MLGRKFCRGLIIQCAVRPVLVVIPALGGDQDTSLLQARKPVVIQALIPTKTLSQLRNITMRWPLKVAKRETPINEV
jgi:hypothetical protein